MPEEQLLEANNDVSLEHQREELLSESPITLTPETLENTREHADGKYQEILAKVSSGNTVQTHSDEDVVLDAKSIGETVDEESKIQKLLDLASTKGVVHAVKVARSLRDDYALDQMHDALANKLYEGLVARGLITKE